MVMLGGSVLRDGRIRQEEMPANGPGDRKAVGFCSVHGLIGLGPPIFVLPRGLPQRLFEADRSYWV